MSAPGGGPAAALDDAQPSPKRPSAYYQIALVATGNVFALFVALVLWKTWDLLSIFQEPLLWAWMFSIALKDFKQFLVGCWHGLCVQIALCALLCSC